MRKILIPTDFSENALNAIKYALELFKYERSEFIIMHAFADEVYAEGIEARVDLAKFCSEEKIDCDLQMTGRFTGAMCQSDFDAQAREVESLNNIDGHAAHMVPKSAQHSEIATDLFFGGMVREEIGGYHPGKFFAGLLRTAQSAGVVIHSDELNHASIIDGCRMARANGAEIRTYRHLDREELAESGRGCRRVRLHAVAKILRDHEPRLAGQVGLAGQGSAARHVEGHRLSAVREDDREPA